jgi:hypothetical protein
MDESQWALLVGSIYSLVVGVVFWFVLRPKMETWELKPGKRLKKMSAWMGVPENQIGPDIGFKNFQKYRIYFMGIFFIVMSIVMMVGFIVMFFK